MSAVDGLTANDFAGGSEAPPVFRAILGDGCERPGRANLRLIRRAIREGWDIPEAKRKALVDHLVGVIEVGNTRDALAAIWCLVEADKVNLCAEHRAQKLEAIQRARMTQ
jgi:hypothetical protein